VEDMILSEKMKIAKPKHNTTKAKALLLKNVFWKIYSGLAVLPAWLISYL